MTTRRLTSRQSGSCGSHGIAASGKIGPPGLRLRLRRGHFRCGRDKEPRLRQMIEATGAELRYLPPYSPDFNPIENAFAKLKALLRKAAERTINGLWGAIGRIIDLFPPAECAHNFSAAGFDAT